MHLFQVLLKFASCTTRVTTVYLALLVILHAMSTSIVVTGETVVNHDPAQPPHYLGPCTTAKLIASAGTVLSTEQPERKLSDGDVKARLTENDLRADEAACDDRGLYAALQCSPRTNACWCVHPLSNNRLTRPVGGQVAIQKLRCWKNIQRAKDTWSVTIQPDV